MRLTARAALVHRELLVAIDRQPFLEAELEPVAAGDAVAGPVVEILVRDDALDRGVVGIGRGLGLREHQLVVEDVEALVLHRAEVEIGDGDDVEHVEIVLAAEAALVPGHRALQRIHGVEALVLLAVGAVDAERHLAAGGRGELVMDRAEIARHHGEQIGRLGERIVPHGIVPAVRRAALFDEVAIGQQHRRQRLVGGHPSP